MADTTIRFSEVSMKLLRSNLGFYASEIPLDLEEYLKSLLNYAFDDFARMGINLNQGVLQDDMDQMVYAAWMYRNGVNGNGKNEMLKSIIRNRQVNNALTAGEGSA